MRTNRTPRLATVVTGVAALLLLGACSGGGEEDTATPAPSSEASTDTSTEPSAPADDAATDTPAAAPGTGTAECLKGSWDVDIKSLISQAEQSAEMAGGMAEIDVTGTTFTSFDGSTMTTTYDDQRTVMVMSSGDQKIEATTVYDGVLTAAITVTDGTFTTTGGDASKLTIESTMTINGEKVDGIDQSEIIEAGLEMGATSNFACDATTLTITPDLSELEGVASGFDLSQTLTRR